MSRDEHDVSGEVESKRVESVFVREGLLTRLRLGGREILSTNEHPFYVRGRGWLPLHSVVCGDYVSTESGSWVRVDAVEETGIWSVVYNLRVADHHTYFIGKDEWQFSVWAHNATYGPNGEAFLSPFEIVRDVSNSIAGHYNRGRARPVPGLSNKMIEDAIALAQSGKAREFSELLMGEVTRRQGLTPLIEREWLLPHMDKLWAAARTKQVAITALNDPLLAESYRDTLIRQLGKPQDHHVFTDKNTIEIHPGFSKPFTPLFEELVSGLSNPAQWTKRGQLSLDVPHNIVELLGHAGPHAAYDALVYRTMLQHVGTLARKTPAFDAAFNAAFERIKTLTQTPGTRFNELSTRPPKG